MRSWIMFVSGLLAACGGGDSASVGEAGPTPVPAAPAAGEFCPAGIATGPLTPSTTTAAGCDAASFDLHSDVAYAAGADHLLDLLVPRNADDSLPVVLWVHGGGWQSGDKGDRAQAQRLACRGYAVASINYRLSGTALFPAQIHDVKAAIRFLRANAATYQLDGARIAVFGSSAGGFLAALAGTSQGVATLEDLSLGNPDVSSRVQAVVDWYGPTRLASMDAQLLAQGCAAASAHHGDADSPESRLLGCTLSEPDCAAQAGLADPARYADATDPPMLLLHGTGDCTVPAAQSSLLAEALSGARACAVMRTVNGASHGGSAWHSPEVQDATAEFLDRTLLARDSAPPEANCPAMLITGDPASSQGARWSYQSTDGSISYSLTGVLFAPAGAGPFPGVVVSHGYQGNASGYSANVSRVMRDWGMVAIATNYTHAPDNVDAWLLPQGGDGASTANVQRAHKARDLLSCVAGVDLRRVAAHGHSMGAFVTGQMLGQHPGDFRAASHSAGGANETGPNATRAEVAAQIRTPYQLHHGDADSVVVLALDQALAGILAAGGVPHELHVYPGYTHEQVALDATMLERVRAWYAAQGIF
jgi:acetyl esterase/lipase